MCKVEYAVCPDGIDCNRMSPITGNIYLELPGIAHKLFSTIAKIQHHCFISSHGLVMLLFHIIMYVCVLMFFHCSGCGCAVCGATG